jgi:DNA repair exonuclease SbcCD ATPase subunit
MKIAVRNFLGVRKAEIAVEPGITLIAGDNFAGKSSLLRGVAALLTGETMPARLPKKDAKAIVHSGTKAGELLLVCDEGTISVTYPEAQRVQQGEKLPQASLIATGSHWLGDLKAEDRARLFADLLQTDPTNEELAAELATLGVNAKGQEKVLSDVRRDGWDITRDTMAENRARLKGQWEEITGERYGSEKAASWRPEGLTGATVEQATQAVIEAQKALQAAAGRRAVAAEDWERLTAIAATEHDIQIRIAEDAQILARRQDEAHEARQSAAALPPTNEPRSIPCPHCGQPVSLKQVPGGTELTKAEEAPSDTEMAKRREAWKEATAKLSHAEQTVRELEEQLTTTRLRLKEATQAAEKLAKRSTVNETHEADFQVAEQAYNSAVEAANAAEKLAKATQVATKIALNSAVIDLLAPSGLRKQKLVAKLHDFSKQHLDPYTQSTATFKPITIDADTLLPLYGGRPYALLSGSEQFRVRTVLQIAFAMLDGSAMVLIDAADILNTAGREDLIGALDGLPIPAMIAMMFNHRKHAPDLTAAGLGHTYWIEKGEAQP